MYGEYMEKYNFYVYYKEILETIPNENNAPYNNIVNNEIVDYIFIDNSFYKYYFLYVSVFSSSLNNIEFIVASYNYYNGLI